MLKNEKVCGCFYCLNIFSSDDINDWITSDSIPTARCPFCGIDSVIGKGSGYDITKEFLKEMNDYWFSVKSFK